MKYRVRIWCRDCTDDNDDKGCFDGGTELLNDGKLFDTIGAAVEAGAKKTRDCAPWEYEVITEDGDDECPVCSHEIEHHKDLTLDGLTLCSECPGGHAYHRIEDGGDAL